MPHKKAAVALSGGIDSLVAAFLLKQQRMDVIGIHFTTGYESSVPDLDPVSRQLDIEIQTIDLSSEFDSSVIDYFIDEYCHGRTPNPCLICNRDIKFGVLLRYARSLGAEYLATGHYAGTCHEKAGPLQGWYIEKGRDTLKDQSYFLSFLPSQIIPGLIFPLSGLTKEQVRRIAGEYRLFPAVSKESQDVCFIPRNQTREFISRRLPFLPQKGDIVDLQGKKLGEHGGIYRFTVGQRRGINCPGPVPYYVHTIDRSNSRIIVCPKKELFRKQAHGRLSCWNGPDTDEIDVMTKIRYNHKEMPARLYIENHAFRVVFKTPVFAVTPGQGAVFYRENRVLGAGIIQ